jgi:hypothetical protein
MYSNSIPDKDRILLRSIHGYDKRTYTLYLGTRDGKIVIFDKLENVAYDDKAIDDAIPFREFCSMLSPNYRYVFSEVIASALMKIFDISWN